MAAAITLSRLRPACSAPRTARGGAALSRAGAAGKGCRTSPPVPGKRQRALFGTLCGAVSLWLLALSSPAARAEAPQACTDEGDYHNIMGWRGPTRAWVHFYSAPLPDFGPFDTWTLRNCRTGWQVSVFHLTPFRFPPDVVEGPPPAGWNASAPERERIASVMQGEWPKGGARRVAEEIASRLADLGLAAEASRNPIATCVCDPMWTTD